MTDIYVINYHIKTKRYKRHIEASSKNEAIKLFHREYSKNAIIDIVFKEPLIKQDEQILGKLQR